MRKALAAVLLILLSAPSFAADPPKTEEQKTLYALGHLMYRTIAVFDLTPAELEIVKQGMTDANKGMVSPVDLDVYGRKAQEMARAKRKAQRDRTDADNRTFEEKAAKQKGAVKTASGLIYLSLKEGTGKRPGPTDTVKVHYRGTLPDGTEFDSSYKRGTPAEFRLDQVIQCFSEGLQRMKVGGRAKLVCPSNIAYGDRGAGNVIPPKATLLFDIELLGVKE